MPDNQLKENTASLLFIIGFSLGFIGLFFSPFLASLGTGILVGALLLRVQDLSKIGWKTILLYAFPIVLVLTDFLRMGDSVIVGQKLLLNIGFAGMALSCFVYGPKLGSRIKWILGVVLLCVLLVNIASVYQYLINRQEIDELLRQSKAIPIFGGMHHIHFGLINALCIAVLLYLLFIEHRTHQWLLWVFLTLFIACFHILSSRTGLVAFYAAFALILIVYVMNKGKWWQALTALIIAGLINLLAFQFSSSYQSKLANSIEDVQSWDEEEAINFKSMGMRLEAYKVSKAVILDNLAIGVGAQDMYAIMQDYYLKLDTKLYKENRIGPHNQLLEYGMKYGLLGIVYLVVFFLFWLKRAYKPLNYALLFALLIFAFAMQFESLLERQVSLFLCAVVLPLLQTKGREY